MVFRPALIARIPLTFILRFDARAVHQKISGLADPCYARANDNVLSRRHNVLKSGTAQSNQLQQTSDKPSRLHQRQTEQHFRGQPGLDRHIAIGLLTPSSTRRVRLPRHLWIEPN